ncbi:MAG TPA: ABC transporter permease [Candidatus Binatia bacterium]|jgi:hypothetical protein|nr:ABC transporter permease [Candidatus Binatia bacterium]
MTVSPNSLQMPPPLPVALGKPPEAQPTFQGALRGIWLFTWRPQLAWRRLPIHLLGLLVLPALVYLTVPSAARWSARREPLIAPRAQVNEFSRRAARAGHELTSEQRGDLLQIFSEETARLDTPSSDTLSGEAAAARRRQEIKAAYDRIQHRAQDGLDDAQFAQFKTFAGHASLLAQQKVRPTWGRTEPFYHWLVDLYFFVTLPLQCVRACGGLIRDELQADTLGFLLTRPLSRARLLVLKYIAQTTWLQATLLLETLLLFAVAGFRQLPGVASLLPLFLGAQLLAVPAWSALGVFLGQLTKRYMPLALIYGLIVEMGIGRIPTNINTLSLMRHLKTLLAHDSGLQSIYEWPAQGVPLAIGSLLFAAALFLTVAALLFTFKEYHHTAEMQK